MTETAKIILGLIVAFAIPIVIIVEAIINRIKLEKANRIWVKKNGKKLRKLCINCSYCKTKIYRPFYGSYELASRIPVYCRKFRCKLSGDSSARCCASDASKAMWENTNKK